jgi:hypothetical protein
MIMIMIMITCLIVLFFRLKINHMMSSNDCVFILMLDVEANSCMNRFAPHFTALGCIPVLCIVLHMLYF